MDGLLVRHQFRLPPLLVWTTFTTSLGPPSTSLRPSGALLSFEHVWGDMGRRLENHCKRMFQSVLTGIKVAHNVHIYAAPLSVYVLCIVLVVGALPLISLAPLVSFRVLIASSRALLKPVVRIIGITAVFRELAIAAPRLWEIIRHQIHFYLRGRDDLLKLVLLSMRRLVKLQHFVL